MTNTQQFSLDGRYYTDPRIFEQAFQQWMREAVDSA
jgi:hypothetical protein